MYQIQIYSISEQKYKINTFLIHATSIVYHHKLKIRREPFARRLNAASAVV